MFSEIFRWLRTKCSRLLRRGKAEAALDAELQFHLDQLVAQFRGEGMTEREARLAAHREFGNAGVYREEIRDTWRPPQLADIWRTLRFALRSLRRSPGRHCARCLLASSPARGAHQPNRRASGGIDRGLPDSRIATWLRFR